MGSNGQAVEVVFFDVRDTLGVVDRPGHLILYKPSTDRLLNEMKNAVGLRIGVISNLPKAVSLAQGQQMLDDAGLTPFLDPQGIVFNHEAGVDKPNPAIFKFAAKKIGVAVEQCLFVGENMPEVIAAQAAGMRATLKPSPPGREFDLKPIISQPATPKSSGRWFERILEEDEHLLGKRIVIAAVNIVQQLERKNHQLDLEQDKTLITAMAMQVYLVKHFIDPFHHKKEEEVLIPLAIARGMRPELADWVFLEHDLGRTYFNGMDLGLKRLRAGDSAGAKDFALCATGFAALYKSHGPREDDTLFPEIGRLINDADDALLVNLMAQVGPSDITPYVALIQSMEGLLGIQA